MQDHAKEVVNKSKSTKSVDSETNPSNQEVSSTRCSTDNFGHCKKRQCPYLHAKRTCPSFSKHGFCSSQSNCKFRHPTRICFGHERTGYCRWGNDCHFRHPIESHRKSYEQKRFRNGDFLGQREWREPQLDLRRQRNIQDQHYNWRNPMTFQGNHQTNQEIRLSPTNIRHHDLRGSRW